METPTPSTNPINRIRNFLAGYSLVLGALAVIFLVVGILIYVFLTELEMFANVLFGFCALFVLLFVIGAYGEVKEGVTSRQARYGTNSSLMAIAFIGIIAALNVITAQEHARWDLTASGQYTLARQTLTVLNNLKEPIKVTGFFTSADPNIQGAKDQSESLLKEYRFHSDKITFEFVDPDVKPAIARQFNVQSDGTLVFESGTRRKLVNGYGEQDFTGAILNVTGVQQPVVYFVVGHGEHDIENTNTGGYGFVRDGLTADNYAIDTLNLNTTTSVPEDASVLVIAGPKRAFLPNEEQQVNTYLDNGGKAMILLDPETPADFAPMLARWGIVLKPGKIVDQAMFAQPDVTTPAVQGNQYVSPQITKDIAASFFPGAIGMHVEVPKDDQDHVTPAAMAITSGQSFLETSNDGTNRFDPATDIRGPLPLGLTVEATKPIGQRPPRPAAGEPEPKKTRMVVFADSDFASNDFFYSLGNGDLMINSVNWLTAQEELISIRPKPAQYRRLVIRQRDWNVILYSTLAFWPMLVLTGGAYAWWRRR